MAVPVILWHTLSIDQTRAQLSTPSDGLSSLEVEYRLKSRGKNVVVSKKNHSLLKLFLAQFKNILIYILLASALITSVMQHWLDAAVIVAVILINALIGFIQEQKAESAIAAIRNLLSPHARVLRDGKVDITDAALLVPGDIVILATGDKVPADIRLIESHSIRAQEATLTGESLDVEKSTASVGRETTLSSRSCMVYCGTLITAGQGKGIVVATAAQTEIGRISTMIEEGEAPRTALTIKLTRLSYIIAIIFLIISVSLFFFGVYIRHFSLEEMFMAMIGIAVSAIPEGLPAVINITMALGARAMAKRKAIVRHLPIIESLGSVTVICTDKTGTLTRNELAITDIVTAEKSFSVTGVGYSPEGEVLFNNQEIELAEHPIVNEMGCAAVLNNDATISLRKGVWEINGDPTEGALLAFAQKVGCERERFQKKFPRTDVIPFSAEASYMATLHHDSDGGSLIYIKGAPEKVLSMCSSQQQSDGSHVELQKGYWQKKVRELAKQGKRVLAVAHSHASEKQVELSDEDIKEGQSLIGLFGIMDNPREEAREAIAACLQGGISVKMITGDHVLTASCIGKLLGIPNSNQVMTGSDIEHLSNEALVKLVKKINIYARMHPEHKLRLVRALQQNSNEVVAMTGDGVNDAPALKIADIGIAMGKQGTDVAKEASDLVLADDNFSSIVRAVEEGRNIYRNIRLTIQFMLVTDCAEGLTLLAAILAGVTLPITPLQILWVNMITAVTLSLAFVFTSRDPSVMRKSPIPRDSSIFSKQKLGTMMLHVLLIAGGTIGLFHYEMKNITNIASARTIAVNVIVFFQIYYLWGIFPFQGRLFALWPVTLATVGVLVFQLGFTYIPIFQAMFSTASLDVMSWLKIIFISSIILVVLPAEKKFILERG